MRVGHFNAWNSVFRECSFEDVDVTVGLGMMNTDLIGCSFSGNWSGNISAVRGRRRLRVEGNDFSRISGVEFYGGVDWRANRFDVGGSQLILQKGAVVHPTVRRLASELPYFGLQVQSLTTGQPFGYSQDWLLLERGGFSVNQWDALVSALA